MRDRLIEVMKKTVVGVENGHIVLAETIWLPRVFEAMADRLLANGVIVPPCKVGSEVCFADHENKSAWYGNLVSYSLDAAHLWFNCHYKCGLNMWHPIEDFGKTVFLTREEAEAALAERSER